MEMTAVPTCANQPALCSQAASPSGDEALPASEPAFYEAFEDLTGAS